MTSRHSVISLRTPLWGIWMMSPCDQVWLANSWPPARILAATLGLSRSQVPTANTVMGADRAAARASSASVRATVPDPWNVSATPVDPVGPERTKRAGPEGAGAGAVLVAGLPEASVGAGGVAAFLTPLAQAATTTAATPV